MVKRARSGHVGSNFSAADILSTLYTDVLNVRPTDPDFEARDRFILSKGHGCAVAYAVLALRGFFPMERLTTYYCDGGKLAGHMTHRDVPGVEVSTGSLGHGLPIGVGMALAVSRQGASWRTFVLMSDGEMDEGTTWEAALFAAHHKLEGLVVIVDYNHIQSLTWVEDTLRLEPLADKWRAFGWDVVEIDGHDHGAIRDACQDRTRGEGRPTCILAHTTKGKGVSFMENNNLWHYRTPDENEYPRACEELGMNATLPL